MVFQKPNPFPKSIFENVAYGIRINGMHSNKSDLEERVEKALVDSALWNEVKDRLNTSAFGLSGGQQQRVAIARALVHKPQIVIADEPTASLDSHTAKVVIELMKTLGHSLGTTFIVATHDPRMAVQCDRSIELVDGQIHKGLMKWAS